MSSGPTRVKRRAESGLVLLGLVVCNERLAVWVVFRAQLSLGSLLKITMTVNVLVSYMVGLPRRLSTESACNAGNAGLILGREDP